MDVYIHTRMYVLQTYIYMYMYVCIQTYIHGSEGVFSRAPISSKQFNDSIKFTFKFISFALMNHYLHNLSGKDSFI